MKTLQKILLIAATAALPACAPVFTQEAMKSLEPGLTFSTVQADPDAHRGQRIMVGGLVAGVRNGKEGSTIEVLQLPMDSRGRPEDTLRSEGRFLAEVRTFLDPLVFRQGVKVSMIGAVVGKKTLPLDSVEYTYPVLKVDEMHLWLPEEQSVQPSFSFGIGFGHSF